MEKKNSNGGLLKIIFLVLAIAGLCGFGWVSTNKYFRGLPPDPNMARADNWERRGPPSPEQRRANMEKMMADLNMSEEQKKQMQDLWANGTPKNREEWQERRAAMEKITTPEQRAKFMQMGAGRMARRMEELKKKLPPEDFAALQKRMEAMGDRRGGRRTGGTSPTTPAPAR